MIEEEWARFLTEPDFLFTGPVKPKKPVKTLKCRFLENLTVKFFKNLVRYVLFGGESDGEVKIVI